MKLRSKAPPQINITLHPAQALAFQTDANEILYGGAAGGGKSHLIRAAAVIWACQIPGLQIYLFRRNFPDLEFNHLSGPSSFHVLLAPMIESGHVRWREAKYEFEFWNGAKIHLCHCQKDSDRFKYLGSEMHVLLIDELSQFTPVVYNFLRTRVRMIGVPIPAGVHGAFPKILAASNPGGSCHQFMKANWVDIAAPMEYYRAPDDEGGMLRQFIPARIRDNPSLIEQDPGYMNRIRGLGDENLVKAYLDGDFSVIVGGLFDDLWKPDIHIIQPFAIPSSWYIDRAFDWGSSKPFSVGWFAESDGDAPVMYRDANGDQKYKFYPRGTIFQVGEWYGWNGKPDEGINLPSRDMARGILAIDRLFGRKVYGGPADAQIWEEKDEHCIAFEMEDEGCYWERADKSPGSRVQGIQRIRSLLRSSGTGDDSPGFYVFSVCKHTLRILPASPRDTTSFEDVMKGYEDHVLDMLRYRVRGTKAQVTAFHHSVS